MFMTIFKWEAKILNSLYKTDRYQKLVDLDLKNAEQIDYNIFYQLTPEKNPIANQKIIQSANLLCRYRTSAAVMQQEVNFMNQYYGNVLKNKDQNQGIEHVLIYSTLSKCRIWPKVLKTGHGFVPDLIQFYNGFTNKYGKFLEFKFDPIILTQKYTKIMNKVNSKKKDHPKIVPAVINSDIQDLKHSIDEMKKQIEGQKNEKEKIQEQFIKLQLAESLNSIVHKGKNISHLAIIHSKIQMIKYLVEIGVSFQTLDDEQQTAIFYAIKRADMNVLRYLVEEVRVNINHRQYQMRTPLYLAAFQGYLEIVDYLIQHGADPELCSKLDRTPLSKACYLGNVEVVKYLLDRKVDILKRDNKGRTALHNAVWGVEGGREGKRRGHIILQDSPQCAQLVIKAEHPIDFQDYDGFTPLCSAVSSKALRSIDLLIKYGANINHFTKNHESLAFIAAKYGHWQSLRKLVEQYKSQFIQRDYHGFTPLCASITIPTPTTFFYLCNKHAQINKPLQIQLLLHCCIKYETVKNFTYLKQWITSATTQQQKQKRMKIFITQFKDLSTILQQIHIKGYQKLLQEINQKYKQATNEDQPTEDDQETQPKANNQYPLLKIKRKDKNNRDKGFILSTILELSLIVVEWDNKLMQKEEIAHIIDKMIRFFNHHPQQVSEDFVDNVLKIMNLYDLRVDIDIHHQHNDRDLLGFLLSGRTNLVQNQNNLWEAIIKLCKFRKTAVIIQFFNQISQNISNNNKWLTLKSLKQIILSRPLDNISIIEYCIVNSISDIAVFLQSFADQQSSHHFASIPQYQLQHIALTDKELAFTVEAVEPWVFKVSQLVYEKLNQKEKMKYQSIFLYNEEICRFQSSGQYKIVDSIEKLQQLKDEIEDSILIGIDVEHFNQSQNGHFACSIQICTVHNVSIIDPFAVVLGSDLVKQEVSQFIRWLLSNQNKIKIFHAYENDLKWIHQDYGIGQCKIFNVVDTNKAYQFIKSKKNISIGLKTLAKDYLNYDMKKDFQRADWRIRPLFKEMIQYACIDAEILPFIYLALIKTGDRVDKLVNGFSQKKTYKTRNIRNNIIPLLQKQQNNNKNEGIQDKMMERSYE